MPSQYVIDLKFRKSDNLAGRSPEAMRSKGFTETHHRLVERFEEVHQHGETRGASGHRSNKDHYKNEGYHRRRETILSAPSDARVHDDQSTSDLPPVSFGKPPIRVPTLMNGRGSSRGARYTVAYRGPHEEDVHPPIPSRDFRVNDKFRQWATSRVSMGGGLQ
ncbi:unnamed protein product [Ixodes hexagonus]